MSHFKHHYLAVVPLLTLLAMSPAKMETNTISRGLASVIEQEVEKPFPKYEELAGKIDRSALFKNEKVTSEDFDKKVIALKEKIKTEKKNLESEDQSIKDQQKSRSQDLVIDLVLLEEDAKILKEKEVTPSLSSALYETKILDLKAGVEDVLIGKVEPKKEVAIEEPKEEVKEEPKKDEPKVEVAKEEPKKEEVKPSENPEICALQEQNKVLSKQVEELLADQKKVNESILNLTSALTQMIQQQSNPWARYMSGPMPSLSYGQQYPVPQQMGGQWIYMTNPQQAFGNAQFPMQGFQDQSHMQGLQTQQYQQSQQNFQLPSFNDSSYAPFQMNQQFQAGVFGQNQGMNNVSYNFSPSSLMMM